MKRRNLDTETNMHTGTTPCEDEGRDCGDASTSQGKSKIARTPQKLEGNDCEGNRFCFVNTLILYFQLPELLHTTFLLLNPT